MLITMYLPDVPCGDLPYTKAIVPEEARDTMAEIGFVDAQPNDERPETDKEPESTGEDNSKKNPGDVGVGLPGSKEFTIAEINSCSTKAPIIELIYNICRVTLDKGLKVAELKEEAIKVIEEKFKDDNDS